MKKIKKHFLSMIAIPFLLVFMLACNVFAAEEVERNNTSNAATKISVNEFCTGELSSGTDVDWYKFTNNKDYFKLQFDVDYSKNNLDDVGYGWKISIYHGDGSGIIKTYESILYSFQTPELPFAGDVLVKVEADWAYGNCAPVDCVYGIKANTYTNEYWECEWNDTSEKANEIEPDAAYKGSLYCDSDVDWFEVEANTGAFNVSLSPNSKKQLDSLGDGWKLSVYRDGSPEPIVSYENITAKTTSFDIPFQGRFLIKVEAAWPYGNNAPIDCVYRLEVSQHDETELWEDEFNDKMEDATALTNGELYCGNFDYAGDEDYFKYKAPCQGVLTLDFLRAVSANVEEGWKVSVLDADGSLLYQTNVKNKASISKTDIAVEKGKTYYVKVEAKSDYHAPVQINYQVGLTCKAQTAAVTNLQFTSTINSIKLTWDKVPGASGYKIYRYDSVEKKYVLIKTTSAVSYKVSDLDAATTKTYFVKAYQVYENKHVNSSIYSKIVAATKPQAAEKPRVKLYTKTTIKLEWDAVARATGYTIYQYNSATKNWDEVKTMTATNYTVKGLTAGTTYKFKIKAYKKAGTSKVYGSYGNMLTTATKPEGPTGLATASRTTSSIKLTWDKVEGASGYIVYRYYEELKGWFAVKTTTSNTFSCSKLEAGTSYRFKVKTYKNVSGEKIWGCISSSYQTTTLPAKAKLTSLVAGKNKVTVKWETVPNASGYMIEYTPYDSFDLWYYAIDVGGSATAKTIKNLYKGDACSVRIRAYRFVNGELVYGAYSTVKSVTVK